MINTDLFNREFLVIRNFPENIDGISQDNYISTEIYVKGRLSNPSIRESNLFANRGMNITAVIYCEPYNFDQQRDALVQDDIIYLIKEIVPTRDRDQNIAFLKIFADESNAEIIYGSS